eukprot:CAMPEP_0184288444 /NCGR_PEP_ID=MMETSP1049-20130417/966_1 /TAXON_ID=77928 /ORGANISM="Proteomonas sulcata, Strain CCMP704" /LENGTH=170 /DNA_ID=CAMNT_0026594841 /DNA_START=40 /DNA_END=549 /DNA_ORIENTATION=-
MKYNAPVVELQHSELETGALWLERQPYQTNCLTDYMQGVGTLGLAGGSAAFSARQQQNATWPQTDCWPPMDGDIGHLSGHPRWPSLKLCQGSTTSVSSAMANWRFGLTDCLFLQPQAADLLSAHTLEHSSDLRLLKEPIVVGVDHLEGPVRPPNQLVRRVYRLAVAIYQW